MKGIFHPSDTSQIDGERQEFLRPTSTKMKDVYRLEESASGKILSCRRCVGRDGRSVAGWLAEASRDNNTNGPRRNLEFVREAVGRGCRQ